MPDANDIQPRIRQSLHRFMGLTERTLREGGIAYQFVVDITVSDNMPPDVIAPAIAVAAWRPKQPEPSIQFLSFMSTYLMNTCRIAYRDGAGIENVPPDSFGGLAFVANECKVKHPHQFLYWACTCGRESVVQTTEEIPETYPRYRVQPCETCGCRMILTSDEDIKVVGTS